MGCAWRGVRPAYTMPGLFIIHDGKGGVEVMRLSIICFLLAAAASVLLWLSATAQGSTVLYLPMVDTGKRISGVACPQDCEVSQ